MRIERSDKHFPRTLIDIDDGPKELYVKGRKELLDDRLKVAIVGSRKHSNYGEQIARTLAGKLAKAGAVVVSGLAIGIDAVGHRGALEAGGDTIAVLGCGLDIDYPRQNRELREQIEKRGLVISEYPNGIRGTNFTFPRRNRIISGLCEATVVVEAGINSGSLITASIANEQGKRVYSVPGNINSIYSVGTNMLIRDGVTPLTVLDDLLQDLGIKEELREEELEDMGGDERRIYTYIKQEGEVTMDDLVSLIKLPIGQVSSIVSIMEMKGIVQTALGRVFLAK